MGWLRTKFAHKNNNKKMIKRKERNTVDQTNTKKVING